MKIILSMLLLMLGFSTYACPDFTGKYLCEYDDGSVDETSITTNGNVYTHVSSEGSEVIVADGQTRRNDDGLNEKVFCEGSELIVEASGDYDGNVFMATSRTQKLNGNLVTAIEINFNGHSETMTQTCVSL